MASKAKFIIQLFIDDNTLCFKHATHQKAEFFFQS